MSSVGQNGHYYACQITTGPQDLRLMLDLADERIPDPFVSTIDVFNGVRSAHRRSCTECSVGWYG
jgi:hypothetical protein